MKTVVFTVIIVIIFSLGCVQLSIPGKQHTMAQKSLQPQRKLGVSLLKSSYHYLQLGTGRIRTLTPSPGTDVRGNKQELLSSTFKMTPIRDIVSSFHDFHAA